ncbi:hypothetical protein A3770_06p45560 [Chloropicon primus]|uniref:Uncharacterized protein n=1 Tax=Chloropicon primus TaxID=1764295 RepID=A0A5B8MN08_9CHLO|nr:hypothetical protein A3770_06p45560 [Chloropicon primus]|eukprot:QDZ22038.1 hypothetical protein A3770_06p45560 [Chloropicon primus]
MLSENRSTSSASGDTATTKFRQGEESEKGQVARDLSLEFKEKENRQQQHNQQQQRRGSAEEKRVTFNIVEEGREEESGKGMAGLGSSSFESPRRRERDEFKSLQKERVGYSPASKLIVPPISSAPFQQLSKVVNGVKDLERRVLSIERLGQEGRSIDAVMNSHLTLQQMEADRKRLETEVKLIQRKLSDISSKMLTGGAAPTIHVAREKQAGGLARNLVKLAGMTALNLLLLVAAIAVAALLTNCRENSFAYETPT